LLFMAISTIVAILIVWFMPKRLTRQEIYNTWILVAFLARTFDQLLALAFKLYDQLGPGVTWQLLAIQTLFPGSIGVIVANYMPKKKLAFFVYALGWTLFATFFEWITLQVGYLVYKHWVLWYSACIYFLGVIFLRWHLSFLRKRI
jgi:hypothetical protein